MLHTLYVKNIALIDEIEVQFGEGLNILTGETGAGKSIILGSINLALGGRYSSDFLRNEEDEGYVEATFFVENEEQMKALEAKDISTEDGVVTLSRKLIGKRSICKLNGETVSNTQLKEVAAILIDIHGQHEHQSLLYKKNHLSILDEFAGDRIQSIKEKTEKSYRSYKQFKEELDGANIDEKERNKEVSFLEFEIREIEEANLKEQEDDMLEEQYRRMVNSKKIKENVDEAYNYTAGGHQNASDLISRSIRCLQEAARYDERAEELYGQLAEVDSLLNDFNRELADYSKSFEFSDEEFYEVENRLNEINRLKSKYGNRVEDILAYCEAQKEKLEKLKDYDTYLAELQKRLVRIEEELKTYSEELSLIRKAEAKTLEYLIKEELLDLNFLDVQFEIVFADSKQYSANGFDEIEFMISMNPGEPIKSLAEVASGGELSRIMLAIKTVMAEKDQVGTLIFDEIDVGISGRTAQKVSEKMSVIGKNKQVICITHLAQIAAMADKHYAIEKQVEQGKTKTVIYRLNREQEIQELARILGGAEITDKVLESAAEMKELAKRTKEH